MFDISLHVSDIYTVMTSSWTACNEMSFAMFINNADVIVRLEKNHSWTSFPKLQELISLSLLILLKKTHWNPRKKHFHFCDLFWQILCNSQMQDQNQQKFEISFSTQTCHKKACYNHKTEVPDLENISGCLLDWAKFGWAWRLWVSIFVRPIGLVTHITTDAKRKASSLS